MTLFRHTGTIRASVETKTSRDRVSKFIHAQNNHWPASCTKSARSRLARSGEAMADVLKMQAYRLNMNFENPGHISRVLIRNKAGILRLSGVQEIGHESR